MGKYSKDVHRDMEKVIHEFKEGKLKSGTSGKRVTNRKQAIAIGLSKARKHTERVPTR